MPNAGGLNIKGLRQQAPHQSLYVDYILIKKFSEIIF
tara:strand:- start:5289 stop:5399 length:111 start_codon:yes stop_codon:yes gene_type:complete